MFWGNVTTAYHKMSISYFPLKANKLPVFVFQGSGAPSLQITAVALKLNTSSYLHATKFVTSCDVITGQSFFIVHCCVYNWPIFLKLILLNASI